MVNLCSRSPCKNKGTCIQEKAESWCLCPSGWTGAYCDVPNVSCEVAASRRGELCPLGRGPLPEAFTDQQRFRGRCGYRGVTRKGLRRKLRGQRERLRDSAEKRVCMPRRLYPVICRGARRRLPGVGCRKSHHREHGRRCVFECGTQIYTMERYSASCSNTDDPQGIMPSEISRMGKDKHRVASVIRGTFKNQTHRH